MGKKYYYARVSSKEQKLDRQIDIFKKMGATDRLISQKNNLEKISRTEQFGKNFLHGFFQEILLLLKTLTVLEEIKKEVKEVMINLAQKIYL